MSKLFYEDRDNESVPKVVDVKPCLSQVLVEILTEKEQLGTQLHISGKKSVGDAPHGYILAMGPSLMADIDKWGFKVGDRVIVSGNYTPVPNYGNSHRERGLVEPSCIKGVLVEEV